MKGIAALRMLVVVLAFAAAAALGVAFVVAVAVAGLALLWGVRAASVPQIHDISTDLDNPPAFIAIAPPRVGAENKVKYVGNEVVELQRKACHDIQPKQLPVQPQTFARARDAATAMDWEMVAIDPAADRIEAAATSFWYIRVRSAGSCQQVRFGSILLKNSEFGRQENFGRSALQRKHQARTPLGPVQRL